MPRRELAAQIDKLVELGYPELLGAEPAGFRAALEPLGERLPDTAAAGAGAARPTGSDGHLGVVLVIDSPTVTPEKLLSSISRRGLQAVEQLYPRKPLDFTPMDSVDLPGGEAYLLLDVDRGAATLNVTPDDAFESISAAGRSPLTIAEGLALLTHYPEFLQPNNCFSLLASRAGDKRVPALWLSERRPKLGWCWAGNPHTWLGSASCGARVGAGVAF